MAQAMTPHDALHALGDLPRYEERLTARAGGITCMVWGLATAGIFLTYAAAADLIESQDAYWAFSLLWAPWVAAAIALTTALWSSHAISLRRPSESRQGLGASLLFTLLFLAIASAVFVAIDVVAGVEWTIHSLMAVASGLFAGVLGAWQRRHWGAGARNVLLAGLAMVAGGIALGLSPLGAAAAGLTAAALVGSAWFGAGMATYAQG